MTVRLTDASYLRGDQYKDAANVNARIDLHARFSENTYGWHPWVFDCLPAAAQCRLLEIGCGPARLWTENAARIPPGWSIVLSDFSLGMLRDARRMVSPLPRVFDYHVGDAQALPFASHSFDCVVANHMLYHVPNRSAALDEIARVLTPAGCLVASTVGERHLAEIEDRLSALGVPDDQRGAAVSAPFTLENGAAQLAEVFAHVELQRYADSLRVTELAPLMAYVASMRLGPALSSDALARLRQDWEHELRSAGAVRITKESGVFIARGRRAPA